jgi:hypothetical protein
MVGTSAPQQAGALPDARGPAIYIRGPSGGSASSQMRAAASLPFSPARRQRPRPSAAAPSCPSAPRCTPARTSVRRRSLRSAPAGCRRRSRATARRTSADDRDLCGRAGRPQARGRSRPVRSDVNQSPLCQNAPERTRTSTDQISPQGPQPCASTNSATGAEWASIPRVAAASGGYSPSLASVHMWRYSANRCSFQSTVHPNGECSSHGSDQAPAGDI